MSDIFSDLPHRRAIIDRRLLADRLDAIAAETADAGHLCGQGIVGLLVGGGEECRGTAHVKNATIGGISNN